MDTDSESECQEIKEALNSVGEMSPSSGEYVESVAWTGEKTLARV